MYIVIHCKLHIIYFFRLAVGYDMTVSCFFGKEEIKYACHPCGDYRNAVRPPVHRA